MSVQVVFWVATPWKPQNSHQTRVIYQRGAVS